MRLLHCHREGSGRMWLARVSLWTYHNVVFLHAHQHWATILRYAQPCSRYWINFHFPPLHPLSYIGCCRAVLTEVYEGLMLPLPPELYCSPATNPTLDSSDSDETPLRSLQEPLAPKMVTANAKRYNFYSIPWRKTLSCIKNIPRRNPIAASFPPVWFATQASKPRSRLLWRNRRRPEYVACVIALFHTRAWEQGYM